MRGLRASLHNTMSSTPLLRLPVEMLRNVTDHLDLQDRVRLTVTNRYLYFTLGVPTHSEFLAAEASEFATSKQLYACKGCIRFRSLAQFADDMRKGARTRSGPEAQSRFCLECGVERGWYSEGAMIAIYGKPAVLGRLCSSVTDHCGSKASCGSRTLVWKPLPMRQHSRYESWGYMTRSCSETRHAQEEYEMWLDV